MQAKPEDVKYTVTTSSSDPVEAIILAEGFKNEFTAKVLIEDYKRLVTKRKEITVQSQVTKAKVTNILQHQPEVKKFTKKQLMAAYLMVVNNSELEKETEKLNEIQTQLDVYDKTIEQIEKQTGLKLIDLLAEEKESAEKVQIENPDTESAAAETKYVGDTLAETEQPAKQKKGAKKYKLTPKSGGKL